MEPHLSGRIYRQLVVDDRGTDTVFSGIAVAKEPMLL